MELGLRERVAMVAAASKGIGFAVARALAEEGCRVSICARTAATLEQAQAELETLAGPGRVVAEPCDVSCAEDLERWHRRTVQALGPVDILVTNTGGPPAAPFLDLSDEQWQAGFENTVLNVVRLCRLVILDMQARGWGRIIHLTSLVAKHPSNELTLSSTLRTGLSALTRLQSNQLAPMGILVNAVLPGHTLTDRARELARRQADQKGITVEEALRERSASIPVGRIADPSEIASAVVFLASERASYITGVSLLVDGGAAQCAL